MSTMVLNKIVGADYKEVGLGRKLPAGDRCLAWFEFGVSERLSVRNHAQYGGRGQFVGGTIASAGFSAGFFITEIANDLLSGDTTLIAFFSPGNLGTDLSAAFQAGGVNGTNQATYENSPLRYSACIQQRVFSSAAYDVATQVGTYDSTSPASSGTNNSVSRLLSGSTQALCTVQEFVASTRLHTSTLRNNGTFSTPSTGSATAAVNHIRDTRTTIPFEVNCWSGSNSVAYSFMVFSGLLTATEKNALYALEKARLTALGVTNL